MCRAALYARPCTRDCQWCRPVWFPLAPGTQAPDVRTGLLTEVAASASGARFAGCAELPDDVSFFDDHHTVTPAGRWGHVEPDGSDVTAFRSGHDPVRQPQRPAVQASGDRTSVLAEQQAALRRVAIVVARGASPPKVFSAIADELAQVLHVRNAGLLRYQPDGSGIVVAVGW